MKRIFTTTILFSAALCAPALAQEYQFTPRQSGPYVNSQGYKITNFWAKPTASGCEGGQSYVEVANPDNTGSSGRVWDKVEKIQGGYLCTQGSWLYGGNGPRSGTKGGSEPDLFIKGGKYYRVTRG